jgi:hypothetical protein
MGNDGMSVTRDKWTDMFGVWGGRLDTSRCFSCNAMQSLLFTYTLTADTVRTRTGPTV